MDQNYLINYVRDEKKKNKNENKNDTIGILDCVFRDKNVYIYLKYLGDSSGDLS